MLLLFSMLSTTVYAQDDSPSSADTEPTEAETESTEESSKTDEIESKDEVEETEKIQPAPDVPPEPQEPPPVPSDSEAIMGVSIYLKNGVSLSGFSPILSVINWKEGEAIYIRIRETWMLVEGEKIESIRPLEETEQATFNQGPSQSSNGMIEAARTGHSHKNYSYSRYVYAPSSIPMKEGEGYVSEKLFVFTSAAYAINDNWTILGGTFTWFPPVLFIVGTKFSYPLSNTVHVSVGGEAFMSGIAGFESLATIGFGGITFGDEEANLTINAGVGEVFGNLGYPVSIAGMTRVSNRMIILTENWLIQSPDGNPGDSLALASIAFRYLPPPKSNGQGKDVWVTDVGLFGLFPLSGNGGGAIFPMPLLEFSYYF